MTTTISILSAVLVWASAHAAVLPNACGKQQVRNGRVVNGDDAYDGEFPWAVSVHIRGDHGCGGAIINNRWILTAAHCVQPYNWRDIRVRVGEYYLYKAEEGHKSVDYRVDRLTVAHPNFTRDDFYNDIALLHLTRPISYNNYVHPICLPPSKADYTGQDATVVGWGMTNEKGGRLAERLQKALVTVHGRDVCQEWYNEAGKGLVKIGVMQMCAGYQDGKRDACKGDSGGPLIIKERGQYYIIGVVSSGIGCARPLLPGLYTRVSDFITWINQHIERD